MSVEMAPYHRGVGVLPDGWQAVTLAADQRVGAVPAAPSANCSVDPEADGVQGFKKNKEGRERECCFSNPLQQENFASFVRSRSRGFPAFLQAIRQLVGIVPVRFLTVGRVRCRRVCFPTGGFGREKKPTGLFQSEIHLAAG